MATVPEYITVVTAAGAAVAYLAPDVDGITCEIENTLNGRCELALRLPTSSAKAGDLSPERRIRAGGREFLILAPAAEVRSRDGRKTWLEIKVPEAWEPELGYLYVTVGNDSEPAPPWSTVSILASDLGQGGFPAGSAGSALYRLLQGTNWTVGTVDTTGSLIEPHDLETERLSVLANIQRVQQLWGGYLVWDSLAKTVSLREESAWQPGSGVRIEYAKNLKGIAREVDSNLVTRLYPFGQDGLTIASVNGGQLYLDNHSHTPYVYEGIWENQEIDDPAELKAAAEKALAELAAPRVTYAVDLADLSALPEYSHESFALGDIIRVVDPEIVQRRLTEADIDAAYGSTPADPEWDPDCDLDGNGKVGSSDMTLFRGSASGGGLWLPSGRILTRADIEAAYGATPSDPRWDPDCDLDNDGVVYLSDLMRFASSGPTEDSLWVPSKRGVDLRIVKHRYDVFQPWKASVDVGRPIQTLASMIAGAAKAADFVDRALRPNPGTNNLLRGFVNTFRTTINSATGKLVWSDDTLQAIEVDGDGNETGRRVRITPGGVGISTDGGQTYNTAMTGQGILANAVIVSDLYALASDDGYTQLKGDGLHVFDAAQQERVHVGRWMVDSLEHYGIRIFAPDGTTMLDDSGSLQTWERGFPDNADVGYPMTLEMYLPPETRSIRRALLRFRKLAFRAYETGSSYGGGETLTISSNTTEASSITTTSPSSASTSGPSSLSTATGGSHGHTVWEINTGGPRTATFEGHYHSIGFNNTSDAGSHSHAMDHTHPMSHTHSLSHTHGMGHTHSFGGHSHGIVYGIYTGPAPGSVQVSVKINGVDRTAALGGPFTADQAGLIVAPYLVVGAWNTIELSVNGLCRLSPVLFIQALMGV